MASSIVRRVASGAALAASAAALVSALATMVLASVLLQDAEDRRLEEAVVVLADLLSEHGADLATVQAVHAFESDEMEHTGMLHAVYDGDGNFMVGDPGVGLPREVGCSTAYDNALRVCRIESTNGLSAVVGAAHTVFLPFLAGAAVLAAMLAAALAWVASRPASRRIVAPLTRLRDRIAQLDMASIAEVDLGAEEGIVEVDALRNAIAQLIVRVERALAQAHRFAANAAHELRTPLTTVRAELELLAESVTDEGAREGTLLAQQKLVELTTLMERLLILSVPVRSPTDAHEAVSLRDLVEDTFSALPSTDQTRVQVSKGDALVHGDAMLLGTMVGNAVANALKFGAAVTTQISIVNGEAVLHIDDDGPGVVGAERESVFEPFYRSKEALRRRVPGHGLGLALIRHIAEAHGGHAAIADKPTPGTRLEIRLPAERHGSSHAAE